MSISAPIQLKSSPTRIRKPRPSLDENGSSPLINLKASSNTSRKPVTLSPTTQLASENRFSLGSISLNGTLRSASCPGIFNPKYKPRPSITTEDLEGEGNKENIPPWRLAPLSSPDSSPSHSRSIQKPTNLSIDWLEISSSSLLHVTPIHVLQFPSDTCEETSDTDSSDDDCSKSQTSLDGSQRLIRSTTPYNKDANVVLHFGRVKRWVSTQENSDSEGDDPVPSDSESDSDNGYSSVDAGGSENGDDAEQAHDKLDPKVTAAKH
ncbi:hypothetical protein FA15DRAFT_673428 [Coprinopsis marcescibilis]|uniref:Uncharacterized protein n=1 Tax=Coprinopsis marcescibilis TaxID=230819 RepID=A0A5C3KKQ6_COPMA|nr:hypothetical protein FA15DRAFT_673428 [Coprinopsis marcescibilis]